MSDDLRVGQVARYWQPNWRKVGGGWVSNPSVHEAVVFKIEENYVEFDSFMLPRRQVGNTAVETFEAPHE